MTEERAPYGEPRRPDRPTAKWLEQLRLRNATAPMEQANATGIEVVELVTEIERLRSLVGRIAAHNPNMPDRPHFDHEGEDVCPWPEVKAELLEQEWDARGR